MLIFFVISSPISPSSGHVLLMVFQYDLKMTGDLSLDAMQCK